jgi:hypothetical protein
MADDYANQDGLALTAGVNEFYGPLHTLYHLLQLLIVVYSLEEFMGSCHHVITMITRVLENS